MPDRAILVVSFGTSYLEALRRDIEPIEWAVAANMPGRVLRRAFTSGMIIRKLERRDGLVIDDAPRALERLAAEGCADVVIQPTHLMSGEEFDKLAAQAEPFRGRFRRLNMGAPLLNSIEDHLAVAGAMLEELPPPEPDRALVFMGHGTSHFANAAYTQLEYVFHDLGRGDVLIGTVEGYPALEQVIRRLEERPAVRRVELFPLMVVAGDHATHDLAGGEPDSWKSRLAAAGYAVGATLRGLGEYAGVRALFARHAQEAGGL